MNPAPEAAGRSVGNSLPSAGVTVGGDQFLVFILADDDGNVADFSGDVGRLTHGCCGTTGRRRRASPSPAKSIAAGPSPAFGGIERFAAARLAKSRCIVRIGKAGNTKLDRPLPASQGG